jgi:DDE superfamily endonuclease
LVSKKLAQSWPPYVTFDEDKKYRIDRWNETYDNRREIFWDTTNVRLTYKPSAADAQRNTYSAYYGGNVAKGGVFIQLCGWIGTEDLFVGSICDTDYFEKSKILIKQQTYISKYDPNKPIPFTIICDRGFLITVTAFQHGGQLVIQPVFAKKHERFTDHEMKISAAIAKDRSGNERGVRIMKLSGYISQGLLPNESVTRLSNVWLCWGFQSNFMYLPIL